MANKYIKSLHSLLHWNCCVRVTALLEYLGLGIQIVFGTGIKSPSQLLRINTFFYWTFPMEKGDNPKFLIQTLNEITIGNIGFKYKMQTLV